MLKFRILAHNRIKSVKSKNQQQHVQLHHKCKVNLHSQILLVQVVPRIPNSLDYVPRYSLLRLAIYSEDLVFFSCVAFSSCLSRKRAQLWFFIPCQHGTQNKWSVWRSNFRANHDICAAIKRTNVSRKPSFCFISYLSNRKRFPCLRRLI